MSRRLNGALFLCLLAVSPVAGVTITLSDPASSFFDAEAPCSTYPGTSNNLARCAVRGYLNRTSLAGPDANFTAAFNNWNLLLPAAERWTLVNGGALANLALDVDQFRTEILGAGNNVGRGTISVQAQVAGANLGAAYYWTQGLFDDYIFTPPFYTTLRYEMDVSSATPCTQPPGADPPDMCAPLYPFQYADRHFFDAPTFPIGATFNGWAYISQANFGTRTLTVYDGVNYGWTSTPEPAVWLLTLAGVVLMASFRRRVVRR